MNQVNFDFGKIIGQFKPMNAVNNGPVKKAGGAQGSDNFHAYKDARIPYARTHDSAHYAEFGGPHIVDVSKVFPDFNANPYDPSAYDFELTDKYLEAIVSAGTKVFYRLGESIEHTSKKYNVIVPADFYKWAVICEHIIRHYNEGWANGFHYDIEYWEIWNEPDNDNNPNAQDCRFAGNTWSGTYAEFFDFYRVAATHLKSRFPHLKIGGPALAWHKNVKFIEGFFKEMTKGERVPLDFFTWHVYSQNPNRVRDVAEEIRVVLDAAGYTATESILDEWNFLRGWSGGSYMDGVRGVISERGAAFVAAAMIYGQNSSIDMMMYYDARPGHFCGMFDVYTYNTLKTYHVIKMFSKFACLGNQTDAQSNDIEITAMSGSNGEQDMAMLAYYPEQVDWPVQVDAKAKQIRIQLKNAKSNQYKMYVLDGTKTMEESIVTATDGVLCIEVQPYGVVYFESI